VKFFKWEIVRREDYEALRAFERIAQRTFYAHRWFAEYDAILFPLWDYIYQRPGFNMQVSQARENFKRRLKLLEQKK